MASSEPLNPPNSLFSSSIRRFQVERVPTFICLCVHADRSATLFCRAVSSTPADRTAACDCFFTVHGSLRHLCTGSASACSCCRRFFRSCNEAVSSSLSLRPDRLLARHRHGLLLPSFQHASHLLVLSSMTTRSTVNCRDRSFTGKSLSLVGCKQRNEGSRGDLNTEGSEGNRRSQSNRLCVL